MGLFDKLFKKNQNKEIQQKKVDNSIEALNKVQMDLGTSFYENKEYEKAFNCFKIVSENTNNSQAQYNLGSMYAQGQGVEQNYMEAAYWFHKAYKNEDEKANKMVTKCLLDYSNTVLRFVTPGEVNDKLSVFVKYVYNVENYRAIVHKNLLELGTYYFRNKEDYVMAAKMFRAGVEYENAAMCQNYLAVLYNAGAGVEQNDLVSLYWFDKAAEQGVEAAKKDRDGIFYAYINNFGKKETAEQLKILVDWCATGSNEAIPIDEKKAKYWRDMISAL